MPTMDDPRYYQSPQPKPNPFGPAPGPTGGQGAQAGGPRPGASGSGSATPAQGNRHVDPAFAQMDKDKFMFDPANPQRALTNALVASGMNPFSMNPIMRTLQAAAPGLANSFMLRGTLGTLGGGNTEESMASQGGMGNIFKQFLTSALTGGGGGISGALRNFGNGTSDTRNALSGAMDAIQRNDRDASTGGSAFGQNVFATTLRDMIMNDPTNGGSLIASLYTPFMSPTMSRSYGNRMEQMGYMAPNYQDWTDTWDSPFNHLIGRNPLDL